MVHKPTFFIVGAPRCGTTSMHKYLREHPEIYMSPYKAPFFFATDLEPSSPWAARYRIKKNYYSLFNEIKNEKQAGSASDLYLYSKEAAKNIKKFNPKAKIIIMLRSPVDAMYSFYCLAHFSGCEDKKTFRDALSAEDNRKRGIDLPNNPLFMKYFYLYRDVAHYHLQLMRYFKYFPKRQIKIILFDELKKDTPKVYKDVLKFLGVDPNFKPEFTIANEVKKIKSTLFRDISIKLAYVINLFGKDVFDFFKKIYIYIENKNFEKIKYPKMNDKLKTTLKKEFYPEILALSKDIGKDVSYWCK